ncbi:MAG: UDP-3-O-(3-hydroxymyristoyl)glucosamine N-acyltransferase [Bacteroidota bacterium]|nr:UDP-3-O-(3-hydroxymyristoyl)glucosamine N-acyltransferase [Bacteroidota bacterium]
MQITAKILAELTGGELVGNEYAVVKGVSKIDQSEPETLSFFANPKYENFLYTCKSSVVLVAKNFNPQQTITTTLIKVDDPYAAFTNLLEQYHQQQLPSYEGISEKASVHQSAVLGNHIYIGDFAVIEEGATIADGAMIYPQTYIGKNVKIGSGTIIYPGVKIYYNCEIGNNCIVHAGTIIGSDGFGHAPQPDRTYKKVPQMGNVIIYNNVEIGANCTIDRATMGSTIIKDGVKLDNLIQVAHNCEIGENTVIAALTGISGSSKLGQQCVIGGQVGFVGHVNIANGTQIGAQSGIMKDITEEKKAWIGSPIYELRESFKMQAAYRNLPEMAKRINELERIIKKLNEQL